MTKSELEAGYTTAVQNALYWEGRYRAVVAMAWRVIETQKEARQARVELEEYLS